ncbi:MAG TPA: hypothetical protein VFU32_02515, partial [Ktedonobacterales bacterium]|nr:hypothetical protein [Ktedonobacterales bacterium]
RVLEQNQAGQVGERLYIPLIISASEAQALLPGLRAYLPHLTVTADSALAEALDGEQRSTLPG